MNNKESHKITERDINNLQNIISPLTFDTVFEVNPFMLHDYSAKIKRDENGNIPNSIILPRRRAVVSSKDAETFRKEYEESMDRLLKNELNEKDNDTINCETKTDLDNLHSDESEVLVDHDEGESNSHDHHDSVDIRISVPEKI